MQLSLGVRTGSKASSADALQNADSFSAQLDQANFVVTFATAGKHTLAGLQLQASVQHQVAVQQSYFAPFRQGFDPRHRLVQLQAERWTDPRVRSYPGADLLYAFHNYDES